MLKFEVNYQGCNKNVHLNLLPQNFSYKDQLAFLEKHQYLYLLSIYLHKLYEFREAKALTNLKDIPSIHSS